ncbi:MAG TPA: type II toxin-antitoxin system Phd/YefM family antitoxin [Thermoanaerobaculia bacterium]|nr:type II toxin-antitoxin system Phd/YefM family antitoxin [Thermoanaerobaculia bacterium]
MKELLKEVGVAEAKGNLSKLIDGVRRGGRPVLIRRHETPVAVLVDPEDFDRMRDLQDRVRRAELRRSLKGKRYRLDDILAELGIAE